MRISGLAGDGEERPSRLGVAKPATWIEFYIVKIREQTGEEPEEPGRTVGGFAEEAPAGAGGGIGGDVDGDGAGRSGVGAAEAGEILVGYAGGGVVDDDDRTGEGN